MEKTARDMLRWRVLLALGICGGLIQWGSASTSSDINVAQWGVATQSSTIDGGLASKAIDGDLDFLQGYCSHTDYQLAPWWRVDLQATYLVTSVAVTNRGDAVPGTIAGAEIRIGDSLEMNGILNARCAIIGTLGAGETRTFDCGGIAGRYVTVIIPSVYQNLTLCEVEVFAPPDPVVNVALRGVAIQSSTYLGVSIAGKAVDGNLRNYFNQGYCSQTNNDVSPWWRVDLQGTYLVTSVAVTNRGDDITDRINGAEIHIGNSLENNGILNTRCVTIATLGAGETRSFNCGGIAGRYVTVVIPSVSQYLALCEVQVFARPKTVTNVALGGVAIQSSTYGASTAASKANDGSLGSDFRAGQCTHTGLDTAPWWRVDLRATYRVASVAVTNRLDAVPERINGAEIHIGHSPLENGSLNPRCVTIVTIAAGKTESFDCRGMAGRYVTVVIPTRAEYLTVCEVQVFALPPDDKRLALKVTAASPNVNLLDTPEMRERVFEQVRFQIEQHLSDRAIQVLRWREDGRRRKGVSSINPTPGTVNCTTA